jgi:N-acetylmuramoyl-L-alanine amidase
MRWIESAGALAVLASVSALGALAGEPMQAGAPQLPRAPAVPAIPAPAPVAAQPRFVVVLDAAHGGSDTGTRLADATLEKDITLALSVHLRSELHARGIAVVTTRESDVNLAPVDRAQTENRAQAAACLTLHATATGSGVHLFTSSLSPAPGERFLPWDSAQAAWVTQSLKLESEIDTALAHTDIPVTLGRASVQPMDHLTCPEVAVEMAPLVGGHVTAGRAIADAGYQKQVVDSLAAALEQWRNDWKQ